MSAFRKIFLLPFFGAIACGTSSSKEKAALPDTESYTRVAEKKDTSNATLYDFMKIVIADRKLDLSYGIEPLPEASSGETSGSERMFLESMRKDSVQPEKPEDPNVITVDLYQPPKCLTGADVDFMMKQKGKFKDFQWDNSRLGFDAANDQNWYAFSVPLFSKDGNTAVMKIEDLCKGLCGTGYTLLFKRNNNTWTSEEISQWIH